MPSSSSSSSSKPKTPEEEDEELIRDLEQKIELVIELLETKKDLDTSLDDLKAKHSNKRQHTGNRELTWLADSKSKKPRLIGVTRHSHTNLELIEAWKRHKKFLDHPQDLLRHLDRLTDRLLKVVERYARRGKQIDIEED